LPTDTPTPEGPRIGRQVCLLAFEDADGDGRRQYPERLLPGVTIRLTHHASGAFLSWTTDGANEPDHCWAGLTDGAYTLRVDELPRDYVATGLVSRNFEVPFTVASVQYEFGAHHGPVPTVAPPPTLQPATATASPSPTTRPTPTPQPTVTGPAGDVCLAVYHDRNGDGFRDEDERYLLDARMAVRNEAGDVVRGLLSEAGGPVCSTLRPGVYTAEASVVPGWEATSVQTQPVLLTVGDRVVVEFGQRQSSRLHTIYLPALERTTP
jgi:hypothetical protein